MKSVALYIRVSTDMQLELSPDSQKELLLDYCKSHDYIVTDDDIFQDLGISGRKAEKRPAFNQMIAMCKSKEHPYDAIIVWKFSRFARNQEESVIYKRMLKKIGVDVISVSEPISDDIGGRIAESIFEIMDEYYSINLSQEVMRGMKENAKRGVHQCRPPYGYTKKKIIDESGKVISSEIVQNEFAPIVKRIFDMHLNGMGNTSIAFSLNEDLISSPNKDSKWTKTMVKYILLNPFYCGLVRWNYRSGGRTNSCDVKDESEWIVTEGTHEPIITRDVWEKINKEYNSRRKPQYGKREKYNYKHWLGGIMFCKYCGSRLAYETVKKPYAKYAYYVCAGRKTGKCTHWERMRVEEAEDYVFEYLDGILENGEIKKIEHSSSTSNLDSNLIELLNKQLSDIEKKEVRIKRAYMDGIDTIEEYKDNKAILLSEKEAIRLKIDSITSQNDIEFQRNQVDETKIQFVLDLLRNESIPVSDKNENLRQIIKSITVDLENEHIDFEIF